MGVNQLKIIKSGDSGFVEDDSAVIEIGADIGIDRNLLVTGNVSATLAPTTNQHLTSKLYVVSISGDLKEELTNTGINLQEQLTNTGINLQEQLTNTGINLHGDITTLTSNLVTTGSKIKWLDGTSAGDIYYNNGNVGIGTLSPQHLLHVTGDVYIGGNLTVTGSTVTIDSVTLTVDDKNIELGSVDSPSDTTADGGGITLRGTSDKTILWANSSDAWHFNQGINITNGKLGIGLTNPSEAIATTGRINLDQVDAPSATVNRLYNVGGTLYWDGVDVTGLGVKDEDNMSSNSAYHVATQQSVKAYVTSQVGGVSSSLEALTDTTITTPVDGHVAIYNDSTDKWVNTTLTDGGATTITEGVGSITISSTDTDTTYNGSDFVEQGWWATGVKDEDTMGTDSNVHLATQQSIKAYVDSQTHGGASTSNLDAGWQLNQDAQTTDNVQFASLGVGIAPSGSIAGSIIATNDVVAFVSSDERLKDNISIITNPIHKILQIRGVEFDWNEEAYSHLYGHDVGVLAQEVKKIMPEVVATRDDGYMAVRYEKMVPLLIEGIKNQQAQIKELQDRLDDAGL